MITAVVHAGRKVTELLLRYINESFDQLLIVVDLVKLCEDAMGDRQRGQFKLTCKGRKCVCS